MPFPILAAAGIGAGLGALSNLLGKKAPQFGGNISDLSKYGVQSYDPNQATGYLMRDATNMINERRSNVGMKAAQTGMDPLGSIYSADSGIWGSVMGQQGNIYQRSIDDQQKRFQDLMQINEFNAGQDDKNPDMFSDILSGAGLGFRAGGILNKQDGGPVVPGGQTSMKGGAEAAGPGGDDPYGIQQLIDEITRMNDMIKKDPKKGNDPNIANYMSTLYNVLTRQRRRKEMESGTYSGNDQSVQSTVGGDNSNTMGLITRQSGGAVNPKASAGAGADPYGIDQLINEINTMNEKIRKGGKEKNDPKVNDYMSTLSNVLTRQRKRKELQERKFSLPGNISGVPFREGGKVDDWDMPLGDVHPALLADNEHVVNAEAASIPGVRKLLDHLNEAGLHLRLAA